MGNFYFWLVYVFDYPYCCKKRDGNNQWEERLNGVRVKWWHVVSIASLYLVHDGVTSDDSR